MADQRYVYLHNAIRVRTFIEAYDEGAQDYVPYVGPARVRISDTADGVALVGLEEQALTDTGGGTFVGEYTSAAVDEALAAFVGKPVYQIVTAGPADELQIVTTLFVKGPRYVS